MSNSFRVATIVAAISATLLASTSTPGFALTPDRGLVAPLLLPDQATNVSTSDKVPPVASPDQADPRKMDASIAAPDAAAADSVAESDAADDGYASLAAAVAAQSAPDVLSEDLRCLAGAIYFEAKGESLTGQLAVAQVVLNRTHSGRFPTSICSVVMQAGQFSFVRGGRMPAMAMSSAGVRTAVAVAQVALNRDWKSQAANALFFHARRVSPGWRLTRVASIGNHVFYR